MFYPTELSTDEYLNDQVIWADYGDYAEDMWSDDDYDIDATDEDYPYPTEDAYLDSYWESLTEM